MTELAFLFSKAVESCNRGASTLDFEDSFVELLRHIELHPDSSAEAEKMFLSSLHERPTPWELISFCMHRLRWQKVAEEARALANEAEDPRNRRVYELILESFKNEWEDKALYSLYST
jgi:hypothetical protein